MSRLLFLASAEIKQLYDRKQMTTSGVLSGNMTNIAYEKLVSRISN